MCGFIALLDQAMSVRCEQAEEAINRALQLMGHRGPDETKLYSDEQIKIGFNRLSIIDINDSHQPLRWGPRNQPGRYVLAFNGEIYNYLELREELKKDYDASFHTNGDSEIILAAYHYWGVDFLNRVSGMFSIALWDTESRVLFCARDPFGIKPLYIASGLGGIAVSSEKKSLLELAEILSLVPEIDIDALQHYTTFQYIPEPETLHRAIRRLESGSFATIRPGKPVIIQRYFEPLFNSVQFIHGDEQARYDEIAVALEDSVARHMRSDVAVGAFLSGGIDSTALVSLAARHNPELITFTVGFDLEDFSEIEAATESAEAIGVRHVNKVIDESEFVAALPEIVWYLEEPLADPSLVPLFFIAREARKYVKVVLSGDGADELFGGYQIYREPLSLKAFDFLPGKIRKLLGQASQPLPTGLRGKGLLYRGSQRLEDRYYGNARNFSEQQLKSILSLYHPSHNHNQITAPIYRKSVGWDPIARMQHVDLFTWLRGDILVKADKMAMANSLELRVPFLDPQVFEVASRLPFEQKITHNTTKYALRRALETIIPTNIVSRKKLGFPVPIRIWLRRGVLMEWAYHLLDCSTAGHLVDLMAVRAMLDDHRVGRADNSRRIWTVLIFILWYAIFIDFSVVPHIEKPNCTVRATAE